MVKKDAKRGRKFGSANHGSPAYHALKIIAGGAAVGIALSAFIIAPGLTLLAKPLLEYFRDKDKREWRKERVKIHRAIEYLRKRRLVKYEERNGKTYVIITQNGKSLLRKFDITQMSIAVPGKWDSRWHLVLFDIPEKYKNGRNALRQRLISLGFYPLQKSTFVFPYNCLDEIDFITRFFRVEKYVQYVSCDDLGPNEAAVRHQFGLLA